MTLDPLWAGLEAAPFAKAIREGSYLFPWIESIHVLSIVLVVGVVAVMDLALLGVASHSKSLRKLLADAEPYALGAFAVAVVSGLLLFSSSATSYVKNPAFLLKFAVMAVAGVNMVLFHAQSARQLQDWDVLARPPGRAQAAGLISLSCWVVIVAAGRWIGFLT